MKTKTLSQNACTHAAAIFFLSVVSSIAETVTWNGSGDYTWTNPDSTSWTGGTYDNGDDAQFLGSGPGTVTLSGTINPGSITVNSAADYTFVGSAIGGSGTLTKDGAGTLSLRGTAANTYSGGTTIDGGTLSLGNNASEDALGSGTVTVNSGGSLQLWINPGGSYTISNAFTMDGGTVYSQDGQYNLTGAMTLNAGGGTLGGTWDNKYLQVSGVISGSGALTIEDFPSSQTGDVILSAANTYSGGTIVNGATLTLTDSGRIGGGGLTVNSGGTVSVANDDYNSLGGAITVNQGGILSTDSTGNNAHNIAGITLNGGTLSSSGNTYNEGNWIFNGDVTVGGSALSTISGYAVGSKEGGGTYNVSDSVAGSGTDLLVTANMVDAAGGSYLTKTGAGTMEITGANNYTGDTTVNGGALILTAPSAYYNYSSSQFNINNGSTLKVQNNLFFQNDTFVFGSSGGGTLEIGAGNNVFRGDNTFTTLGGSQNAITGTFLNSDGGGTRTFNIADGTDDVDLLVSAQITNTASIAKTGAGTMVLSGNNTYTGATTVDGGVLVLDESDNTYHGGAININNGATLRLDNQTGTFLFQGDSFNFGASGGGTLEIVSGHNHVWSSNNTVTTNGGTGNTMTGSNINTNSGGAAGTLTFNVADGTDASDLTVSTTISNEGSIDKIGLGTLTFTGANSYSGTTTVNAGTLSLASGSSHSGSGAYTVNGGILEIATGVDLSGHAMNIAGVISPGNSPGTAATGAQTWLDGGSYLWEINNSDGTKGVDEGWDWLDITGELDLTNLATGGFTIDIASLTTANDPGFAAGFSYSGLAYGDAFGSTFIIASADTISGFDDGLFILDDSDFINGKLEWSISESGTDLVLSAVFVPEPSSAALLGLGGLALMLRRKRS